MRRAFFLFTVLLIMSFPVHAQSSAEVYGAQMPAWVERAGQRIPVRAGMPLEQADVLETGVRGRMQVQLGEGSLLKVGELAHIALAQLQPAGAQDGVFKGLLEVVKGAFRLTTSALSHARQRDISVRVSSLTIGIRGTDIWGRTNDEADTVCLIEGSINVAHASGASVAMDQPLSFISAPHHAAPKPVSAVDPEKLKKWAAETELQPGAGVIVPSGGWVVQLASYPDAVGAEAVQQQLRQAGYPADVAPAQLNGKTYHRVRVAGFDTQADARAFARAIQGKFGVRNPWVALETDGVR